MLRSELTRRTIRARGLDVECRFGRQFHRADSLRVNAAFDADRHDGRRRTGQLRRYPFRARSARQDSEQAGTDYDHNRGPAKRPLNSEQPPGEHDFHPCPGAVSVALRRCILGQRAEEPLDPLAPMTAEVEYHQAPHEADQIADQERREGGIARQHACQDDEHHADRLDDPEIGELLWAKELDRQEDQ